MTRRAASPGGAGPSSGADGRRPARRAGDGGAQRRPQDHRCGTAPPGRDDGRDAPSNGRFSVADPRTIASHPHTYGWCRGGPSHTITGNTGARRWPSPVADPCVTCQDARNSGIYGVLPWAGRRHRRGPRLPRQRTLQRRGARRRPCAAVPGHHRGGWHLAPASDGPGCGCSGFPATVDGAPFTPGGSSSARRVKIGDARCRPAARRSAERHAHAGLSAAGELRAASGGSVGARSARWEVSGDRHPVPARPGVARRLRPARGARCVRIRPPAPVAGGRARVARRNGGATPRRWPLDGCGWAVSRPWQRREQHRAHGSAQAVEALCVVMQGTSAPHRHRSCVPRHARRVVPRDAKTRAVSLAAVAVGVRRRVVRAGHHRAHRAVPDARKRRSTRVGYARSQPSKGSTCRCSLRRGNGRLCHPARRRRGSDAGGR